MISEEELEGRIKKTEEDILALVPNHSDPPTMLLPNFMREGYIQCRKQSESQLQQRKESLENDIINFVPVTMDAIFQFLRILIHRVTVMQVLEEKMQ